MKKFIGYLITALVLAGAAIFVQNNISHAAPEKNVSMQRRTAVRASHILVNSEIQAQRLKKDIEAGKITFEEAAKKYSSCPSGRDGGDLGFFGRNQMVKEFETAAFKLPIGKISDPVKTEYGYHLIKVTGSK